MDAYELSMKIGYAWLLFETLDSFENEMQVIHTEYIMYIESAI